MNDRDALIEDATKFANWNENHGRTIAAKMIRALISLASPSPAQWPEDVVLTACKAFLSGPTDMCAETEEGEIFGAMLAALGTLPPPEEASDGFATELIQWLEARGHSFPGGLDADTAISLLDDHEAALTTPEERVKGLVEALEELLGMAELFVPAPLSAPGFERARSALASYRGGE